LIAGDFVVIIYEPPNINLPNIRYVNYEKIEVEKGVKISVEPGKGNGEKFEKLKIESLINECTE
jgi:hypothetical protein